MNEMDHLETQLHGWVLRRPSARVERRLFEEPRRRSEAAAQPLRLGWLAPVTAALLVCMLVNQRSGPAVTGGGVPTASVAMIVSNQSAQFFPSSALVASNVAGESFEWTNGNSSTSSISSLSVSRGTN